MYKILIVEDEPLIAESMKRYLLKWGNEVECVIPELRG